MNAKVQYPDNSQREKQKLNMRYGNENNLVNICFYKNIKRLTHIFL